MPKVKLIAATTANMDLSGMTVTDKEIVVFRNYNFGDPIGIGKLTRTGDIIELEVEVNDPVLLLFYPGVSIEHIGKMQEKNGFKNYISCGHISGASLFVGPNQDPSIKPIYIQLFEQSCPKSLS